MCKLMCQTQNYSVPHCSFPEPRLSGGSTGGCFETIKGRLSSKSAAHKSTDAHKKPALCSVMKAHIARVFKTEMKSLRCHVIQRQPHVGPTGSYSEDEQVLLADSGLTARRICPLNHVQLSPG